MNILALALVLPIYSTEEPKEIQKNQTELKEEILRIEKQMKELSEQKSKLQKRLEPPKQKKNKRQFSGKVGVSLNYQGGSSGRVTGSGSFDGSFFRSSDSFRFEEYLDAKSTNTSTAWRNQATFTYRRRLLPRLQGLAEGEVIHNDGLNKRNVFLGGSLDLLKKERLRLTIEAGIGSQHRNAFYLAGMQRTTTQVNLWDAAELNADVKLIFSEDDIYRFDLDENRVRFSIDVGRSFAGIKLAAFYRFLDDRLGQDYSLAGIRFGKNFQR